MEAYRVKYDPEIAKQEALDQLCQAGWDSLNSDVEQEIEVTELKQQLAAFEKKFEAFSSYMIQALGILRTVHQGNEDATALARTFQEKLASEFKELEREERASN